VTYQQSRQRTPQLAAAPHTGDYPVAMRGVQDAYQPYPHYRPYQSYQAQQMPAAMMYPAPGWVQPFSDMAQAWQQQMPVFVRQLPWRPAEQPWTAQPGVQGWPRYPVAGAPRTAEFRPGTAGYPPAYGSWRPADRPPQAAPRFAYQAPVYTAPQQYGYRTVSAPAWQVPGSRMAGLNPAPAGLNRFQWRPVSGAQRSTLRADVAFRPAAYGRSQRGDERVAWRGEVGGNSTQHKLPGWVTTYEDSGFADSCSWCSGS
jgi:hypothetical protein